MCARTLWPELFREDHPPRGSTIIIDWTLPHPSLMRKTPPSRAYGPALQRQFSNRGSTFLDDSSHVRLTKE